MSDERGDLTPQELDELASAYLDGEATPEEAALVESDPRMQTLVEELQAVRDLVAAPVEMPSDEMRDQMIAVALDHRAPVVPLDRARRWLRTIPPQGRVILAAAAVVAVIAVVGVTIFERQGDEFADDDMASAPVMTDAPSVAEAESPAPAAAAERESMEAIEESAPTSDAADSAEALAAEAPADEDVDGEMALQLGKTPMDDSDQPTEEQVEFEAIMADEPEVAATSGESLVVFETAAGLVDYALILAEDLLDAQETERLDNAAAIDLMDCPLFPDEELELLARFGAFVGEAEIQVSIYLAETHLQLTETTPPPECELLDSRTFLDWLK